MRCGGGSWRGKQLLYCVAVPFHPSLRHQGPSQLRQVFTSIVLHRPAKVPWNIIPSRIPTPFLHNVPRGHRLVKRIPLLRQKLAEVVVDRQQTDKDDEELCEGIHVVSEVEGVGSSDLFALAHAVVIQDVADEHVVGAAEECQEHVPQLGDVEERGQAQLPPGLVVVEPRLPQQVHSAGLGARVAHGELRLVSNHGDGPNGIGLVK